jgi:FkbM family methyltransferase
MFPPPPKTPPLTLEQYQQIRPLYKGTVGGKTLVFHTPNMRTAGRASLLLDKEPVTIEWLNRIQAGQVMFDVGANMGVYSIYAGIVRKAQVFAFEPEAQNYALLNRNIEENRLSGKVVAFPIALSDSRRLDHLHLSSTVAGSSGHSFSLEVGPDLKPRSTVYSQGSVSFSIDEMVESGALPVPDHIKIDVDGLEHLVVRGAMRTLADPKVRSLIVEINHNLAEHQAIFPALTALGFTFKNKQLAEAIRSDGKNTGLGEVVFYRKGGDNKIPVYEVPTIVLNRQEKLRGGIDFSRPFDIALPFAAETRGVLSHVLDRINSAPIATDPFPHIVVDGIFPDDYYRRLQESYPPKESFVHMDQTGRVSAGAYKERMVVLFDDASLERIPAVQRAFWLDFGEWLYSDLFMAAMIAKFAPQIEPRLPRLLAQRGPLTVRGDAQIVRDHSQYAIGPHTDAPHRLITFLFYCPEDDGLKKFGTSFYRPKQADFTCPGGTHHPFEKFERATTVDFLPNRLVAFPKTERCFHGVERIDQENVERRLLINDVRILNSGA